jgi:8-oxo-dGTP pyrophosphatase MutT (NUDIX family)
MRDGKLLLGLRAPHKKAAPNTWDIIGGHVEQGESDEQAMLREVEEEAGVKPTHYSLILTTRWEGVEAYAIYTVTTWSGGEPRLADNEHTELAWFTAAEAAALPNLAAEEYRNLFRKL